MDEELSKALTKLIEEVTLERQRERERQEKNELEGATTTSNSRFWSWLGENITTLSTLVTVLAVVGSAVWTVYQFGEQQQQRLEQQQREDMFRQQERIIAAVEELNDADKRNTAAYSLAILSGEEALPLLISEFRETFGVEEDESYRRALAQALILVGEPALKQVLDMNRQAAVTLFPETNKHIVLATQPVILHYLTVDKRPLSIGTYDLTGVTIIEQDLSWRELSDLDLSGIRFLQAGMCGTDLSDTHLVDAAFVDSQLGHSRFDGAVLHRAKFSEAHFDGLVSFRRVDGSGVEFADSDVSGSDFQQAKLDGANFNHAQLNGSHFTNADLEEADFTGAFLQEADFSGSNLAGTIFFRSGDPSTKSDILGSLRTEKNEDWYGTGAYVKGANFEGAQNISEETRVYLCRWGAMNVPGGCEAVTQEAVPDVDPNPSGFAGSCF